MFMQIPGSTFVEGQVSLAVVDPQRFFELPFSLATMMQLCATGVVADTCSQDASTNPGYVPSK